MIEGLGGKVLPYKVHVDATVPQATIKRIGTEIYLKGKNGLFIVGKLVGGQEVELYLVSYLNKYERLITDKLKASGYTIAKRVPASWLNRV